ncbi:hypothetical protein EMPS_09101 [Entomortierella parvispora]|uniref:Uncharacterized protein n=1 Tax=Entomortierella parvispora TaxID=205924 RepID=A0A9P3HI44_9FUNG|nr:hypothetical protein EMPS_09101 [Entomortierella parvispora]
MAKKKVSARKTRQSAAASAADQSKGAGSKAASLAPSNASSPSPQPLDQVQAGRRKGLPRRSPSQNDPSKGIVFSFRFQNDSAMSMAVDIHSYDQQFDSESTTETGNGKALSATAADSEPTAATTNEKSLAASGPLDLSHIDNNDDSRSLDSSLCSLTNATSSELRLAGEKWSSDPTLYRSSNVFDKSRNLLILHTRKPAAGPLSSPRASIVTSPQESTPSFHPYRRSTGSSSSSSLPSTPALSQSGSTSSSSSSSSSSPRSPSSPTPSHSGPTTAVSAGTFQQGKDDSCSADSLPAALELSGSRSTRFLKVRGLGGASGGRRMQVILVS